MPLCCDEVRRVFQAADSAEAGLLRGLLEDAGIVCALRQEQVSQTFPTAGFSPEVWVERDEDFDRALALISAWSGSTKNQGSPWTCPACGEVSEAAFDTCWNCGYERPADAAGR